MITPVNVANLVVVSHNGDVQVSMYTKSQSRSTSNRENWTEIASFDEMIHLHSKEVVYSGPVWLNISPDLSCDVDGHGHPPEHDTCVEKVDPASQKHSCSGLLPSGDPAFAPLHVCASVPDVFMSSTAKSVIDFEALYTSRCDPWDLETMRITNSFVTVVLVQAGECSWNIAIPSLLFI